MPDDVCEYCGTDCGDENQPCPAMPTSVQDWDEEPDPNWPVGEEMECYQCPTATFHSPVKRKCVALGPVVNPADPTQSYKLECGHLAI